VTRIVYRKSVLRDLERLTKAEALHLLDRIEADLAGNPEGNPSLRGRFRRLRRLRVEDFRIVYTLSTSKIIVLRIGMRRDVQRSYRSGGTDALNHSAASGAVSVLIHPAVLDAEIAIVRDLFREYATWLDVDLCFQGFEAELAALPGKYAPPGGSLLLAFIDGEPAGCIALRPMESGACEMKRLYVRPAFRGRGLGRALVERLLDDARSIGYRLMRLDTLDKLTEAMALYDSMGFRRVEPYYDNPLPGVVYWERPLP
jgi:GNAT superfamily N-acetyltransferase